MQKKGLFTFFLLLFLLSSAAAAQKSYILHLSYIDDNLLYTSMEVSESKFTLPINLSNKYIVQLSDSKDKAVYTSTFTPYSYGLFNLALPYMKNVTSISIKTKGGAEILNIPVMLFSNTCGNKVCEEQESYETCRIDCPSGRLDDYCDGAKDLKCDPDCEEYHDIDCQKNPEKNTPLNASPKDYPENKEENISVKTTPSPSDNQNDNTSNYKLIILSLIVAAIFLIITTLIIIIKSKNNSLAVNQIKDYVITCVKQGYSIEEIKQTLLNSNYKEKDVNKAIKSIRR